ncbi:hypothetical protein FRC01_003489 [Tulasnella sp. 417]|nr:hypothetical protein FRC01_003489 [Tulasnella sp. 417]
MSSSSQVKLQPMQQDNKASIFDVATDTSASKDPNLAPPRTSPGMRKDVKPPFANTPLSTFIYTITLAAAVLAAFFAFRAMEWKSENGMGLVNLLMGKGGAQAPAGTVNPNVAAGSAGEMDMDATGDL